MFCLFFRAKCFKNSWKIKYCIYKSISRKKKNFFPGTITTMSRISLIRNMATTIGFTICAPKKTELMIRKSSKIGAVITHSTITILLCSKTFSLFVRKSKNISKRMNEMWPWSTARLEKAALVLWYVAICYI